MTPLTVYLYIRVGVGVVLGGWQLQYLSSRRSTGAGTRLLAEGALKDWACRTVGHEVAFFTAEEAEWGATIQLMAGRAVEVWFLALILVDVASRSGRRCLGGGGGCCGRCGDSGHCCRSWGSSFVGGILLVRLLEVLFQDPDLVLHGVDLAFHLGVCLLLQDLFDSPSGCDDVLHCPVA